MSEINNNEDLNEGFEIEMDDSDVITVPIDATLTQENQAADAAAVGAALALKADASAINTIKVNDESADNQGQIYIDGTGIPMSGTDATTLQEAIAAEQNKTAADIPMTSEEESDSVAEVLEDLQGKTAANIPMSSLMGAPTIAEAINAAGTVKSVNNTGPDANGNVQLNKVPIADNLDSSTRQNSSGEFIVRTAGGSASLSDGSASLMKVLGNSVRSGYTPESLDFQVNSDSCDASITNMAAFREEMGDSGTLTLSYTTEWSDDPADYGITVVGTPDNGDSIVAVWVKEIRGLITNAQPTGFSATGWNLFNRTGGYARVVRYSDDYGYAIGGAFTSLAFSATESGERTTITPGTGGLFQVPSDGYVWVTGEDSTTAIWATWSDWTAGYQGDFAAYSKTTISLATIMGTLFPDGLCAVGDVKDYIDIAGGYAYNWIDILEYSAENLAVAEASGRPFTYDEENILLARASAVITALTSTLAINGSYVVNGHGLEMFDGATVPVGGITSYGADLKNRLERDVALLSQQTLSDQQKKQVRDNIGAVSASDVPKVSLPNNTTSIVSDYSVATGTDTTISAITLNKGINICVVTVSWASNANGYRTVWISSTNTGAKINLGAQVTDGTSTSGIRQQLTFIRNTASETETLYIRVKQTSGSALNCSVRFARVLIA